MQLFYGHYLILSTPASFFIFHALNYATDPLYPGCYGLLQILLH
ncbi:hypothetical protein HMPREF1548_06075 [Clostridium sp. KLE 1755]|nr:hypothetical protein HMPREF1548_06075 [Clostridium sp. KLE 1755]